MKTEQEQLCKMINMLEKLKKGDYCLDNCYGCCGDGKIEITCPNVVFNFIQALAEAGYGDVSEYEAEIEQLNKKLAKQIRIARDANAKFTGVEHYLRPFQYKADRLQTKCNDLKELSDWQRKEIKRLKAENAQFESNMKAVLEIEKKQAQIDVLNRLKRIMTAYSWQIGINDVQKEIDELIKEIENAEDKS